MKVKRILIQNIRSYDVSEIEFPEGNVLLSGNIGSGKSTILLAVEFALFGLQRGVGGNILLRNGQNVGGVKLELEIDGKNVKIERKLKRSNDSIKQDSCYLEVDGSKEQLSSTELKSKVLSLLNYSQELIAKNPLIYRYTVYTPQEEMKNILTGDPSLRLTTLKKVFGIDRYRKVIENSSVLVSDIKEKIKEKEGRTADIEDKKAELSSKKEEKNRLQKEITALKLKVESVNKKFDEKKKSVDEAELKIRGAAQLKAELAAVSSGLKTKKEQLEDNRENVENLESRIGRAEERISKIGFDIDKFEEIEKELKHKEAKLNEIDSRYLESTKIIAGEEANKLRLHKITKEIMSLENCPTCRQKVGKEHKHEIDEKTKNEIEEIERKLKSAKKDKEEIEVLKKGLIKEINDLRVKDKTFASAKVEIKNLEEIKSSLKKFGALEVQLSKEIKSFGERKEEAEKKLEVFKDIEKEYNVLSKELEEIRLAQKTAEISKARSEKQLEDLESSIEKQEKEVAEKERIKLTISKLKKIRDWVSVDFIKIVEEIEKAVMSKVHHEFSMLFGKWFSMLAEGLSARINEEFSPVIEQQGYEIEYAYLSGGERTAAALAYRLALNQVINSIMSEIKTKDILILDEPTEGFSSEQLDKMRDVLNELKIGQIILVSHEAKIESFVENIIRFQKDEVSKILPS